MTTRLRFANNRVLIVDDQPEIHEDFADMLRPWFAQSTAGDELAPAFVREEDAGSLLTEIELLHANTGEEACSIIRSGKQANRPIAVAFIDIRMSPSIDGVETIRRVRRFDRDVEIVIMTAYTDKSLSEIVHDMELLHKLLYIRKPFVHEEIQQVALSLMEKWNVEQELVTTRQQLGAGHRRLEAVLDATGDPMVMLDRDGRPVCANRGYQQLLGLQEGELSTITPDALAARAGERLREPDLSDVQGRLPLDSSNLVETTGADQVARQRLFYRSTAPVRDGAGEEIGSLEVYRDVSREIEAEQIKTELLRLRSGMETNYSFAGMVGTSPQMERAYALMKQAAGGDITVLVRGESGTGKELVARSLHLHSQRKDGPFVVVDCASIPATLIESELFGHERGAFTGAATRRIGAFERADGGTVVLDEIGEMPYALQSKLLRVLQERAIQRVGGSGFIAVDIRVIAATNRDLERAVEAGEFREDLFYRIAAFPIVVPPLRERREDIPLLARHFLDRHAARADKVIGSISTAAMSLLLQYEWPGNVRELENAIERAVLLEASGVLQAGSLPPRLSPIIAAPGGSTTASAVLPLIKVERQALAHALEVSGHNVERAARGLGISRATLYRKLKKHGLAR